MPDTGEDPATEEPVGDDAPVADQDNQPVTGSGDEDDHEGDDQDDAEAPAEVRDDADAPADPVATAAPAEPVAGTTEATRPLTRSDLAPRRPFGLSGETVGLIVIVALGLVMGGFILGRVTANETTATTTTTTPTNVDFPSGDVDRSGYWAFASITPAVTDAFDRPDDPQGLGTADTGQTWREATGNWEVRDGRASAVANPGATASSIAVVDGGSPERLSEITLAVAETGAGLVFRFQDQRNYWAVTVDEGRASWTVYRVADGRITRAGSVAAPATDGTTISVAQRARGLQFLVEGVVKLQLNDGALADATRSGLISPRDGQSAFDRFFVGDLPPEG